MPQGRKPNEPCHLCSSRVDGIPCHRVASCKCGSKYQCVFHAGVVAGKPMLDSSDALLARLNAIVPFDHVYFERQRSDSLTCLVHALNNILGSHMITVERMKQFAQEMFMKHLDEMKKRGDKHINVRAVRSMFYDPQEGNFSQGVAMWFAKTAMGLKLKQVFPVPGEKRKVTNAGRIELYSHFKNHSSRAFLIFESRQGAGHAICTKTSTSVLLLDSLADAPKVMEPFDIVRGTREWTVFVFVKYDDH